MGPSCERVFKVGKFSQRELANEKLHHCKRSFLEKLFV